MVRSRRLSTGAAVALAVMLLVAACVRIGGSGSGGQPGSAGGGSGVSAGWTSAQVERVVDGDTAIFVLDTGARERVRFIGVDTPESTKTHEPFGAEASAYTKSVLVPGRRVLLEPDAEARDRYGRLLAYVWLDAPSAISDAEIRAKMLNAKLALGGYAQQMTIPPNVRYAERFRRYVAEAREANRGLWALGPVR